ncbi:MAG: DedA family protein [Solirubrobacteraceae bacterium]
MFLAASITSSLVTLATHIIHSLGLWGVGGLVLMSAVIGLPGTEAPMLFAGFNVYQGSFSLVGIIAFGVAGDLLGASIAYAIAYFGLHEALARPGSPLHISERKLETAHAWFDRYGAPVIIVSRLIPLLRAAFPYAAGIAEMAYWRFIALAAVGSVIWISGLALLGRAVGSDWAAWRQHLEYVDYAAILLAVGAIVYVVLRQRQRTAH